MIDRKRIFSLLGCKTGSVQISGDSFLGISPVDFLGHLFPVAPSLAYCPHFLTGIPHRPEDRALVNAKNVSHIPPVITYQIEQKQKKTSDL